MKVDLAYNGCCSVALEPESRVEEVILQELLDRAIKGQTVKINKSESGIVISIENQKVNGRINWTN